MNQLEKSESIENSECPICHEPIWYPVKLECNHYLCRYCITDLFNRDNDFSPELENEKPSVNCPLCKRDVYNFYNYDKEKQENIVKNLFKNDYSDIKDNNNKYKSFKGIYKGIATTINDVDKNITESEEFYLIIGEDNKIFADICWKAGTENTNYFHSIARLRAEIRYNNFFFSEHVQYSGNSFERWFGEIENTDFNDFVLYFGRYTWFSNFDKTRKSQGDLIFELKRVNKE